jgi:hypothetical protein
VVKGGAINTAAVVEARQTKRSIAKVIAIIASGQKTLALLSDEVRTSMTAELRWHFDDLGARLHTCDQMMMMVVVMVKAKRKTEIVR